VSPAVRLAQLMGSSVLLITRTVTLEFFLTQGSFTNARLRRLALTLTSALCTALLE
jgi:hypothetical protein